MLYSIKTENMNRSLVNRSYRNYTSKIFDQYKPIGSLNTCSN